MRFSLHSKSETDATKAAAPGDWYSDPFGQAARRWYDEVAGWTDRTQGEGEPPDRTGVTRIDQAAQGTSEPGEQRHAA